MEPSRWDRVLMGSKRVLSSRPARWLLIVVLVFALGWALRGALLRSLSRFLVAEDVPCHVDAVYVLGGSAMHRGEEAAHVYHAGWGRVFRFTGEPVPTALEVEGIRRTEAQQTRMVAVRNGVPDSIAVAMDKGTSTWEESEFILDDARANGYDTVMILSSRFHLRRIDHVFRDRFRDAGITVVLHGARNGDFDDDRWWKAEEGLLFVNNEYVKLMYYLLKY